MSTSSQGSTFKVTSSVMPLHSTDSSYSPISGNSRLKSSSTATGVKRTPRILQRSSARPATSEIIRDVRPHAQLLVPFLTISLVLKRTSRKERLPRGVTTATPSSPSSTSRESVSMSRISTRKYGSIMWRPRRSPHMAAQAHGSVPPIWS